MWKGSLLGSASRSVGGGGGRSVAQRPKRRSRRPPMPVSFGSVFIRMYCSELFWIQVFRVANTTVHGHAFLYLTIFVVVPKSGESWSDKEALFCV